MRWLKQFDAVRLDALLAAEAEIDGGEPTRRPARVEK
jgi:hypothetical protein